MAGPRNALNFAYILYLALRAQGHRDADIERHVRQWFVMSVLTGRYSGSPESTIDYDIRQIQTQGIQSYPEGLIRGELSDASWDASLVQELDRSAASSQAPGRALAAQAREPISKPLSQPWPAPRQDVCCTQCPARRSAVRGTPRQGARRTGRPDGAELAGA